MAATPWPLATVSRMPHDSPARLFRFRPPTPFPRMLREIYDGRVWMAHGSTLNDPFDGVGTKDEEPFEYSFVIKMKNADDIEEPTKAKLLAGVACFFTTAQRPERSEFDEISTIEVPAYDSMQRWTAYGGDREGIAIEYDGHAVVRAVEEWWANAKAMNDTGRPLAAPSMRPVEYVDKPHEHGETDADRRFFKTLDWEHEAEWRICAQEFVDPQAKGFAIDRPEAIRAVYLGPGFRRGAAVGGEVGGIDLVAWAVARLRLRTRNEVPLREVLPLLDPSGKRVEDRWDRRVQRHLDVLMDGNWRPEHERK